MSNTKAVPGAVYDQAVEAEARRVGGAAIDDFLAPRPGPRAVVVAAPAGAGKTQLVTCAVARARHRGLRVAVGAPTNDQAFALVRRLAAAGEPVSFLPASKVTLPAEVRALGGVRETGGEEANAEGLVVGTLDKLGD